MVSAILPILAIAVVGYLLSMTRPVDAEPLATVSIYVLLPALVFYSLATSEITAETTTIYFVGVTLFTGFMASVAELTGRVVPHSESALDGLVLSSSFPNVGNFGIPFMVFAFGAVGRSAAVLFVIGQSVFMYSFGVYVASRGEAISARAILDRVLKLPLLYATVGGLLARYLGLVPPTGSTVMETIRLTGDAAIPVMLLLLGIELANVENVIALRRVVPGVTLKLLLAPVLAIGIALAIGLTGTVGRVFVLETAMPTAITPLALAIEFGNADREFTAAEYVGTTVLVSTVLSVLTLSGFLVLLTSSSSPI